MPKTYIKIITTLVILFSLVTGAIAVFRALDGSNDFDTFYYAGRDLLQGIEINYLEEGNAAQQQRSPFLYPPFAACFFMLFAWMPIYLSAFLWNTLNVILFVATILLLLRFMDFSLEKPREPLNKAALFDLAVVVIFSLVALLDNITMAQMNILVFFLIVVGLTFWKKKRCFVAGLLIAAAALMKVTPALFILYFLAKRSWRVLAGIFSGLFLFSFVLCSLATGIDKNLDYHRQWAVKMIQPLLIEKTGDFEEKVEPPFKNKTEIIEHNRLTARLVKKNQSLEAALTRLLLKDRNRFAQDPHYPIYVARKYENMPTLFGGIPERSLGILIRGVQFAILFSLFFVFAFKDRNLSSIQTKATECSLVLLSMTLLSPVTRSHHQVIWIMAYMLLFFLIQTFKREGALRLASILRGFGWGSLGVYLMQGLPYGKAAGMGTLSNLLLWLAFALLLIVNKRWRSINPANH